MDEDAAESSGSGGPISSRRVVSYQHVLQIIDIRVFTVYHHATFERPIFGSNVSLLVQKFARSPCNGWRERERERILKVALLLKYTKSRHCLVQAVSVSILDSKLVDWSDSSGSYGELTDMDH
jgi:hypothetical protein